MLRVLLFVLVLLLLPKAFKKLPAFFLFLVGIYFLIIGDDKPPKE